VCVYYMRKVSWSEWIVFKMDQENMNVRMCVEVLICDIYSKEMGMWFVGMYVCLGLLTYNM
jgi:hypothetical protein